MARRPMLIDTDVLIWATRGYAGAIDALDTIEHPALSIVTMIELMQGARDTQEMRAVEVRVQRWGAEVIAIDPQMSIQARKLIRDHTLAQGLQLADALIAATAIMRDLTLFSANRKHFEAIDALDFAVFIPTRK